MAARHPAAAPPGAAPRPLRVDAQRNRERLVEAARSAFAEHGVEASLDDIARAAGVGSGTLYRHFPTRTSLLEAVFTESATAVCTLAGRSVTAGADPAGALRDWLHAFAAHVATFRGIGVYLIRTADDDGAAMARTHHEIRDALASLLDRARAAGALRAGMTATDLLVLVNGITLATRQDLAAGTRLLDLVLDGLVPDGPVPPAAGP